MGQTEKVYHFTGKNKDGAACCCTDPERNGIMKASCCEYVDRSFQFFPFIIVGVVVFVCCGLPCAMVKRRNNSNKDTVVQSKQIEFRLATVQQEYQQQMVQPAQGFQQQMVQPAQGFQQQQQQPLPQQEYQQQVSVSVAAFCGKCGNQNQGGEQFCRKCGNHF